MTATRFALAGVLAVQLAGCAPGANIVHGTAPPPLPEAAPGRQCYEEQRIAASWGTAYTAFSVRDPIAPFTSDTVTTTTTYNAAVALTFYRNGQRISNVEALEALGAAEALADYRRTVADYESSMSRARKYEWIGAIVGVGAMIWMIAGADPDDAVGTVAIPSGVALIGVTVWGSGAIARGLAKPRYETYRNTYVDRRHLESVYDATRSHNQRVASDCGYDGPVDASD